MKTPLSFFLLSMACAAPILRARQETQGSPAPSPSPSPLDLESLIAHSPLNGVYKMIKEEVKGVYLRLSFAGLLCSVFL
ncbi:uncharacterized protein CDV56_100260 [Aspergillus thermomutatus]|uniref:Uncharacterized protein n=1 Tax=Aspergillus thermomutatus TaxID=41047 RepID=A0A397GBP7_ASPTH|nr:uncharacterized protein CDV56_100260 [Aspergillus thermomutatus]RHZ47509.1 hypothetical protein CDV56_100260 [Aspergillus thermomutatus]